MIGVSAQLYILSDLYFTIYNPLGKVLSIPYTAPDLYLKYYGSKEVFYVTLGYYRVYSVIIEKTRLGILLLEAT